MKERRAWRQITCGGGTPLPEPVAYRARYAVPGAKSDVTDVVLLANIVRTDAGAHRHLPADTELAQAIRVLARAQQDAVWSRQRIANQIRDLLKDFYPAAIAAFAALPDGGLAHADARTVVAAALRACTGARRHYDTRRAAGDCNHQAQRHLFNKFLGQLRHCLHTGKLYDEHRAFPFSLPLAA